MKTGINKQLSKLQQGRLAVQTAVFLFVCASFIVYRLYLSGFIGFKLAGIGALNPFAGYDTMFLWVTKSFYQPNLKSFALILAGTILFLPLIYGRLFCGWICPFGTLQDYFSYLGHRIGKYECSLSPEWNQRVGFFKYGVLASIIFSKGAYGSSFLTSWDPWTAFANLPVMPRALQAQPMAFILLALAVLGAVFLERFFCRYLCPLGALQGLVSLIGLGKIGRWERCTGCGDCHDRCPVGIQLEGSESNFSPECIHCLKCVELECRMDHGFHILWGKKTVKPVSYILISFLLFASSLYVLCQTGNWIMEKEYLAAQGEGARRTVPVYRDGVYTGRGRGFAPDLEVMVQVRKGRIAAIDVVKHQETWGYYEETFEVLSRNIIERQSPEVDVITGATYTGKGLKEAMKNALEQAIP